MERTDAGALVSFFGELDLAEEPQASAVLAEIEPSADVVVDLAGLDFIDSSGIRVIVAGAQRAREAGGTFAVAGARGDVLRVLELIEAGDLVPLYDDVADARAAAAAGRA